MIVTALSATSKGAFITPKDNTVGKGGSNVKHIHHIWCSVWDAWEVASGKRGGHVLQLPLQVQSAAHQLPRAGIKTNKQQQNHYS